MTRIGIDARVRADASKRDTRAGAQEASEWGRRVEREEAFDLGLLAWSARFAFVTAATAAARWGVSEQRMRARLRRLEREGWVRRFRLGPNEPVRVVVTELGAERVGLVVRTPRGREPLGHELAVIKRVLAIERYFAERRQGARVLTERDMRREEAREGGSAWWVEVVHPHGRRGRRWADYVVDSPDGRTAVELEFSLKATRRLRSIVRGYVCSARFSFVDFVVLERAQDAGLWRCLERVIAEERALLASTRRLPGLAHGGPVVRVVRWRDPLPALHAGVGPFPALGASA